MPSATPAVLLNPEIVSAFPVVNIIGTAYALTAADVGQWIRTLSSDPVTVTLTAQDAGDSDFPAWASLYLQKGGAGDVTLVAGPGVTIQTSQALVLTQQYSQIQLKRVATNVWTAMIIGDVDAGATAFTELTDVPGSYAGSALMLVRVTAGEDGLEFHAIALADVPGLEAALLALDNEKVDRAGDTMTGSLSVDVTAGSGINLTSDNITTISFNLTRFLTSNTGPNFGGMRARGTKSAPLPVLSDDQLFTVLAGGYFDNSGTPVIGNYTVAFELRAAANHVTASRPTYMVFLTTPIGSAGRTERVRISSEGELQMGGANTVIDQNRIFRPRSYTIATLPTITPTGIIFVSDLGGGGDDVRSNATQWVRENRGLANIASDAAAAFTWTYLTNAHTIRLNLPTTADRAVTLSTTNVPNGARVRFVRTAASTGGFAWNIGTGPLKNVVAGSWADVEFDGTAWQLVASGSL